MLQELVHAVKLDSQRVAPRLDRSSVDGLDRISIH